MLDAVPQEAGQCEATVGMLQKATGLSVSAIKSARRDLLNGNLWIAQRGVYVPYPAEITTDVPSTDSAPATSEPANDNVLARIAC